MPYSKSRPHPLCSVDGCVRERHARGFCSSHDAQARSGKELRPMRKIRPRNAGSISSDGYMTLYKKGNVGRLLEHRVVMERVLGRALMPGENVHHKNGNRLDNRPDNLELWVTSQPPGQRPEDLVAWAREILERYA